MLLIALTILGKEDQAERLPVTWAARSAFLLTMLHHVACGGHEDVRVVLHIANAEVAAVAQEAAYLVGFVVVVNSPGAPGARLGGLADRAPPVSQREQPVVVGLRDAVQGLELDVSPVRSRAVIYPAVFADRASGLVRYGSAAPLAWPRRGRLTASAVLLPPPPGFAGR